MRLVRLMMVWDANLLAKQSEHDLKNLRECLPIQAADETRGRSKLSASRGRGILKCDMVKSQELGGHSSMNR